MIRQTFDWSRLDRQHLYKLLNKVRKNVVGKKLLIEDLHKILSKQVKNELPVTIKMFREAGQEPGLVYIGGCYYGDKDKSGREKQIEIIFSYCLFDQFLTVSSYYWTKICETFADTVLHEIIHMRQYRTRNFKLLPGYQSTAELAKIRKNQNYYGHPDEIGAYAFNIACEVFNKFGYNKREIVKYLNGKQSLKSKRGTYTRYLRTFEIDHQVIKKLKKKVLYYLPYAEIGKPFKTSDYLTY